MRRKDPRIHDSFRVLGLEAGASRGQIQNAYRRLIKRWHPDRRADDPSAEETAKDINEAFTLLQGLSARELAALGTDIPIGRRPPPPRRPTPRQPARRAYARSTMRRRGRDEVAAIETSWREVYHGARWRLRLPTCRDCGGWGAALDGAWHVCPDCDGLGLDGGLGSGLPPAPCRFCAGRGSHFDRACATCRGSGESELYTVGCAVPPGVTRPVLGLLEGLGHPGVGGGAPGDLYLVLSLS